MAPRKSTELLPADPPKSTTLHLRESGFQTEKHQRENDGGWTQELGELAEHLKAA